MKAQAVLFTGRNKVETGPVEIPEPGPGEILVEAEYTCVSPGTDLRCLAGLQTGSDQWPFIPGYSMSGRVCATGTNTSIKKGTKVFCMGTQKASVHRVWGGHCSHAVLTEGTAFVLPEAMDLKEAVLLKLAAITYHGVRQSKPEAHENVAVIGLGPIGQLAARTHALSGARVVAADVSLERVELARKAGIEAVQVQGTLQETFQNLFPQGADIVADSTGSPAVLKQSPLVLRDKPWDDSPQPGGRLLIQGSFPDEFTFSYRTGFAKEISVLFTRDHQRRDLYSCMDFVQRGKLKILDLLSAVRPPNAAADTYAELSANKGGLITVAFGWR